MRNCPKCGCPVRIVDHKDWIKPTLEIRCTKCDMSVYALAQQHDKRKNVGEKVKIRFGKIVCRS